MFMSCPCDPELCVVLVVARGVSLFELQLTSGREVVLTLLVVNREDVDIGATLPS